jgi:hypothetical protein
MSTTSSSSSSSAEPEAKKAKLLDEDHTTTNHTNNGGSSGSKNLQSMKYSNEGGSTPKLAVLDQLLIPHEKVYIDIPDVETAWSVIREMQIRGTCMYSYVYTTLLYST